MKHVFSLLLALLASACVLFVGDDPGSLGATCKFSGSDTPCGKCIAATCQSQVNACCVRSGCRDRGMAAVDACASGKADQCISSDLDSDVTNCIGSGCAKECLGGITSCTRNGTSSCHCTIDTFSPNAEACAETTVRNSICCADSKWPARGESCSCEYWGCDIQSTRCDCSTHSSGGSTYKDACYPVTGSGLHCCVGASGSCSCTKSTCLSSEMDVADCSLEHAGCQTGASFGKKRVKTCTP